MNAITLAPALPPSSVAVPVVFPRDGKVVTTTPDVAAYFGRPHRNILSAVDRLIAAEPNLCPRHFQQTSVSTPMPNGGTRTDRQFEMTCEGFALLAMGFTGSKALRFKVAYVTAFSAMQDALRTMPTDPTRLLRDPVAMRQALLSFTEQLIDAEAKVAELAPSAAALGRLSEAQGSLTPTNSAKALGITRTKLFEWLRSNGWTFRGSDSADRAYQTRLSSGDLEQRVVTVQRPGKRDLLREQVYLTAKGLAKVAKALAAGGGA